PPANSLLCARMRHRCSSQSVLLSTRTKARNAALPSCQAATARHGRTRGGVAIRCLASPFRRHKREVRTQRIDALRDPRTTWYLHRPVQHLAFALGDAPERGIEGGDVLFAPGETGAYRPQR